jgi:hypothetical protein
VHSPCAKGETGHEASASLGAASCCDEAPVAPAPPARRCAEPPVLALPATLGLATPSPVRDVRALPAGTLAALTSPLRLSVVRLI